MSGWATKKAHIVALALMAVDCGPRTRVSRLRKVRSAGPFVALPPDRIETDSGTARAAAVGGEGHPRVRLGDSRSWPSSRCAPPTVGLRRDTVRPVLLPVAVVGIDRVGGAVERNHGHGTRRGARAGKPETGDRGHGGEDRRCVAAQLAGHAGASGKARGVDASRVDAVPLLRPVRPARSTNDTSSGRRQGTAAPPISGSPGTFQSNPVPSGMSPWG